MLFWRKTDETIWKTPLREHTLLSTNPLFLSNFLMTPLFVQISKTRYPPPHPPSNIRGEETGERYEISLKYEANLSELINSYFPYFSYGLLMIPGVTKGKENLLTTLKTVYKVNSNMKIQTSSIAETSFENHFLIFTIPWTHDIN